MHFNKYFIDVQREVKIKCDLSNGYSTEQPSFLSYQEPDDLYTTINSQSNHFQSYSINKHLQSRSSVK